VTLPHTEESYDLLDRMADEDPIRLRDMAWLHVRANAAAEERGYQRAIAVLRDRAKWLAWLAAPPADRNADQSMRDLFADYLTAHREAQA
jgi:hypothetical protein